MSRTNRRERKTGKEVRDGARQYITPSCEHGGSCAYCRGNRTFSSSRRIPAEDDGEDVFGEAGGISEYDFYEGYRG